MITNKSIKCVNLSITTVLSVFLTSQAKLQTGFSSITLLREIKAYNKLSFHSQMASCLPGEGFLENNFYLLSVLCKSYIVSPKTNNRKRNQKKNKHFYLYHVINCPQDILTKNGSRLFYFQELMLSVSLHGYIEFQE